MDYQKYQSLIQESAAQGTVLLKNEKKTLPLSASDRIAVFGRSQINYYKSGTGSGGSVHVPYMVNLLDGFENLKKEGCAVQQIDEKLMRVYKDWIVEHPFDSGNGEWASEPWCQEEMELTNDLVKAAAQKANKAVFIIGRTAGEDQDNKAEKGSYYLTGTEQTNLKKICRHFSCVIVVLNVSNIIDLSWLENPAWEEKIAAVLFSWQGGMQGGQACADVLCGKTCPSGKLTDSIAYRLEDYPSSKNFGSADDEVYQEDIYVGYRYFTTFAREKVQFPFGFGLSYTSFRIEVLDYQFDASELRLSVEVTNTGSCAGQEVVQVYASCPQGTLGKSEKSLCAFEKTRLLAPNEQQVLRFAIPVNSLASYDDSGESGNLHAFVLEKGTYSLFVGTDCFCRCKATGKDGSEFTLSETVVVQQLTQCGAPEKKFTRFRPGDKHADGLRELLEEPVPLSKENLGEKIRAHLPKELKSSGKTVSFAELKNDLSLIDDFIAQLSEKELLTLVRGEGMMSRKVTAGIASAFGGISERLHDGYGIPAVGCSDGPSGIRLDNGFESTAIPIGTLLACTWNPPLVEELYGYLGEEMKEKLIDVLLGPGCNIHRNPLNGRNFEYFSEDPYVSGVFAIATCKGLARSGSIGTIKHFALNNQESHRRTENSVVSERALREIYLRPFEMAIKEGGARAVMTSYNGVNGRKSASNFDLDTVILRDEWGFTGLVMTDWWAAMNDCEHGGDATGRNMSQMIRARNDVYMVVVNDTADKNGFGDDLADSLKNGTLSKAELQQCAKDIMLFITETLAARTPLRPLKSEVTVKTVLDSAPAGEKVYALEEYASGDALDGDMYFVAPEDAFYEVYGSFCKDGGDTLSQSVCNVIINGESIGSFSCRSTGGTAAWSVASQLFLKKGYYKARLEHTKPGMQVLSLCLRQEEDSPISTGEYA
ncbi:MAG: glycoside hydrolase family 3 protein [Treponema sp.]|nr:glycoside hydrolase family 3 protein [Treponema sp.]